MELEVRRLQTAVEADLGGFLNDCESAKELTNIYLMEDIGRISPRGQGDQGIDSEFYSALERAHSKILNDASNLWLQLATEPVRMMQ